MKPQTIGKIVGAVCGLACLGAAVYLIATGKAEGVGLLATATGILGAVASQLPRAKEPQQ